MSTTSTAAVLALPNPPAYCKHDTPWVKTLFQLRVFLDEKMGTRTVEQFAQCTRNRIKLHKVGIHMGNKGKNHNFGSLTLFHHTCTFCKMKNQDFIVESLDAATREELSKLWYWYLNQCPGNHSTRVASFLKRFPNSVRQSQFQNSLRIEPPPNAAQTSDRTHIDDTRKNGNDGSNHSDAASGSRVGKRRAIGELPQVAAKRLCDGASLSTAIDVSDLDSDSGDYDSGSEALWESEHGFLMSSPSIGAASSSVPATSSPVPDFKPLPRSSSPILGAGSSSRENDWTSDQLIAAMSELRHRVRTGTRLQSLRSGIRSLRDDIVEGYRVGRLED
ncbi:hypothetical protein VNI00_019466 [Paramarasmius palmivorus]|uniref:Uncharacterized protein n=1 Tax=Paramarasmius palmivorus TaxID=297713 RepID=A0AAW0AK86_9AGAR